MATDSESFNRDLYDLLKVRGYEPTPLDSKNQRVSASQDADVIEFTFKKDGEDYGSAWVTVDDAQNVIVYYDSEQQESPSTTTPGVDYDDSWTGLLKFLKNWAQRRQMSFELANKDRLGDDMRQRDYYRMKEKLGESYHPMGKKASYNDAVPSVKIILQHNRALEEGEQRYRNVAKIFLENQDGERFLAPTTRPGIARVYARHIAEGGVPNDERWNHIKTVVEDYNKMAGFVRATRNGQFNESALELVTEGVNHYNNLRETLKKMAGHRGYHAYFESWTPTLMEGEGEDLSEMFMSMSLDPRIESAMPILSRLKKPVTEMEEVDTLAEWADEVINEKLELDELSPAKKWDYTEKGRKNLDTLAQQAADADDSESAKKYAEKAVKRQYKIDKTEKSLAHGTVHEKMDSTTKSLAVPADKMLEAPGAETLAHNQSTEKSNLKAFDLAENMSIYVLSAMPKHNPTKIKATSRDEAIEKAAKMFGVPVNKITLHGSDDETTISQNSNSGSGDNPLDRAAKRAAKPREPWYATLTKSTFGLNEGDVVKGPWQDDEEDWDDESWIPSIEDFEQEEQIRNRTRKPANDIDEDLNKQQKAAGQVGPTEKAKKISPILGKPQKEHPFNGKLVGAESKEVDPELARIIEMARFKR